MEFTMKERKKIFKAYASQYQKANKPEKKRILDEIARLTGCSRDYIAWVLRNHGKKVRIGQRTFVVGDVSKKRKKSVVHVIYDKACQDALEYFWTFADRINSKRLKQALPYWIEKYKLHIHPQQYSDEVLDKLCAMSHGTIDRLLTPIRAQYKNKRISHTKSGALLKHQIMIRTHGDWNEKAPGFLEMDLVAHEGGNPAGEFCSTLNMIDIETCWCDFQAIKNKAHAWVLDALVDISHRLPFTIKGLDSDCGGEFINHAMVKYCDTNNITFTRGRSYRKNDNCYIEQKNSSVIRKSIFHYRYDTPQSLILLNKLYDNLRLYVNYFIPCSKLIETTHDFELGKTIKKRDEYRTPYQRILDSKDIGEAKKQELTQIYQFLNPFELKKSITAYQNKLIKEVSRQQKAQKQSVSSDT